MDGATKIDDARVAEFLAHVHRHPPPGLRVRPRRLRARHHSRTSPKPAPSSHPSPVSKYSYAQLDDYTDLIGRTLLGVTQTSRVERKGVLPQAVYLDYSQQRLAAYGFQAGDLSRILNARNITLPGGSIEAGGRDIQIDPSGQFENANSIGNVIVGPVGPGAPGLSARSGPDQPRLSDSRDLPEFLFLDR